MSVINRIILFFYALAFGAVSLITLGLFARIFPDAQIWNEFLYLCSRWETAACAAFVFILSLYLLLVSLSASNNNDVSANEAMIVQGKMGDVRISLAALKNMADRIARSASGVRDVKVKLKMTKASAKDKTLIPCFKLRLVVLEEKNIVSISDEIKQQIKAYLNNYIGIDKMDIQIDIQSISNTPVDKKKRVV